VSEEAVRTYVSVAVPCHNEVDELPELYRRLKETLDGLGVEWELVVVDDMSTDGSRDMLRELADSDPRVRVVLLSRNFGLARVHVAALRHSSGTWTVVMDSDLQDEPEAIPQMLELAEQGHDVVYAVRSTRGEGRLMRAATATFYALMRRIAEVPHPSQAGSFSILSRRAVEAITSMPERNVFFPGLRAFVGFDQVAVPLHRPARPNGPPRISVRSKIAYGLNALFAFSNAPLRLATWLGLVVATAAGVLALVFVYFKYFTDEAIPGFTGLITVMLFLGGVQLLTLGVIGEYVGRIYNEVKRRPRYVVDEGLNVEGDVDSWAEVIVGGPGSEGPGGAGAGPSDGAGGRGVE
jgi:polyisoprenyl-phosphate glycosyltransferase